MYAVAVTDVASYCAANAIYGKYTLCLFGKPGIIPELFGKPGMILGQVCAWVT
jgi:hypothetical protein